MVSKSKRATLSDVARAAKVAKSTASLAFSTPDRVAPDTVRRVKTAAKELGFHPNPIAQSLKSRRGAMIGLLIRDLENPLFAAVLALAQNAADQMNSLLLTATSEGDPKKELAILEQFERLNIKGVILTSAGTDSAHAARLNKMELDIVTLDLRLPDLNAHHIGLDNAQAAAVLTRHLLDYGHQHIAMLTGSSGVYTAEERARGFERTMQHAGLDVGPQDVIYADFSGKKAYLAAKDLLARPDRPTAIVTANSFICASVLRAIKEAGLRCPEDISLVSVDKLPYSEIIQPTITCVVQPLSEMASLATQWIASSETGNGQVTTEWKIKEFAPELIIGDSVRTPES